MGEAAENVKEPRDEGYGTYKGRTITSVSMEFQRRSDDVDAVYDIDDEFVFIGRARVQKHLHEVQADGAHLIMKVAAAELYRVDEGEGRKLLGSKREKALKAEAAREERDRLRREDEEGVMRLPIGADAVGHPGELEGDG